MNPIEFTRVNVSLVDTVDTIEMRRPIDLARCSWQPTGLAEIDAGAGQIQRETANTRWEYVPLRSINKSLSHNSATSFQVPSSTFDIRLVYVGESEIGFKIKCKENSNGRILRIQSF